MVGCSAFEACFFIPGILNFTETIDEKGDAEGAYWAVALVSDAKSADQWKVELVGTFTGGGDTELVGLT